MEAKDRVVGLDLVRSLAIASVLLVHSISFSGVMDKDYTTVAWSVYLVLRFAAMTGVPLFLMLSGYLCIGKKLEKRYYLGIIPIIFSYVVISVIGIVADNIYAPGSFSLFRAILGTLNFTANGYAWYVEMYIGLFLLIPFINILWEKLETKGKRQALIATLAFLTVLASSIPSFHLYNTKLDVIPDYWTAIYPITFYVLGAYLREYPVKLTAWQKAVFVVASTALPCALCTVKTHIDGSYAWYMMNGFSSVTVMLTGIAYFTALCDVKPPRALSFVARQISLCSFEMYLFSYVTDRIMQYLAGKIGITKDSVLILFTYFGSLVLAFAVSLLFRLASVPITGKIKSLFVKKLPSA